MCSNPHNSGKIVFAKTLRNYFLLFLIIHFLSAFSITLRSDVEQIYKAAKGRLSDVGAICLDKYYISSTLPCDPIDKVGGWQWKCTYKDGYTVYNCFRKCRGTMEVANYFLGLVQGDCDACSLLNGVKSKVCYSDNAARGHFQKHGPVIAIRRIKECRE